MSASHVQGPWTCARLRLMSNLADPPFLDRGKKILMLSQGLPWLLSPTHFFPEKKEKNNSALDNQSAGWEDYVRCEQSIKSDQQIWNYLLWSPSGRFLISPKLTTTPLWFWLVPNLGNFFYSISQYSEGSLGPIRAKYCGRNGLLESQIDRNSGSVSQCMIVITFYTATLSLWIGEMKDFLMLVPFTYYIHPNIVLMEYT